MPQKFKRSVVLSENGFTVVLFFLGIYKEFLFGQAQEGDIKGIAVLIARGVTSSMGNVFCPTNLDYVHTSDKLCADIENKNILIDRSKAKKLYEDALKKMKNEA